jgi:hypothetical protein
MSNKPGCGWIAAALVVQVALGRSTLAAAPLSPGEIVVAAQSGGDVYRVNPVTGSVSLITTGWMLNNPSHVLIDRQGRILTAERTSPEAAGIIRIDPATGIQQGLVFGLDYPVALAFDANQNLYVGALRPTNDIFHIDLGTGAKTPVATLRQAFSIQDIDVDSQGRLLVLDFGFSGSPNGKVLRVDPVSGASTTVSSGGNLFNPADLLVLPSGDLLVSNRTNSGTQILKIDPDTGAQQVMLSVPSEGWIALEDPNTVIYADFGGGLSIVRADLRSGATSTVTSYQFPHDLVGMAVYQVPEPSSILVLWGLAGVLMLKRRR